MKITFEGAGRAADALRQVRPATTYNAAKSAERIQHQGGISADISGIVKDNEIFPEKGKTFEDIRAQADHMDVGLMRDYMTVMSNILSGEDMGKLMKDGINPADTHVETTVTIMDRIKASLLQSGVEVTGFTDSIDDSTLDAITGNAALSAQIKQSFADEGIPLTEDMAREVMGARDMAADITSIPDDTAKYMVEHDMEPTIDDIYTASHKSLKEGTRQAKGYYQEATGYLSKKAEDLDWKAIEPQARQVIEKAGLPKGDVDALNAARWLVEKGIPLTPEHLMSYMKISDIDLPVPDPELFNAMAATVSDGKSPMMADLYEKKSSWEKAADLYFAVRSISQETVDAAASRAEKEDRPLTLRDMMEELPFIRKERHQTPTDDAAKGALSRTLAGDTAKISLSKIPTDASVKARRQLEEIRLVMTIQANRELIKSGYAIDTAPIEETVEALKKAEQSINERLFGNIGRDPSENEVNKDSRDVLKDVPTDASRDTSRDTSEKTGPADNTYRPDPRDIARRADIFQRTIETIEAIPRLPAAVAGAVAAGTTDNTLPGIREEGERLAAAYRKAGEQYELLGTQVRRDLGDTIKQAFRNIDDILADMTLPVDEANRRALRILGYNSMEISEENIAAVKEADLTLRMLSKRMTPEAVLEMIRDDVNPLSMTVEALADYLNGRDSEDTEREKYAKFLYKLDRKKEITKEEKESFIGIYRLIRQVEKSDGAVIGSLVNQGADLTLKNLLSAVRTRKNPGIDISVDDDTEVISSVDRSGSAIDAQIESAFYEKALSAELYRKLDDMPVEEIARLAEDPDVPIEDIIWQEEVYEDNVDYIKAQSDLIRSMDNVGDDIIRMILSMGEPVTAENLAAMDAMKASGGPDYRKIRDLKEQPFGSGIEEDELESSFEDADRARESFREYVQRTKEAINDKIYDGSILDGASVKELGLLYKQMSFVARLSEREQYEIPVYTEDDVFTLHLKVESSRDELEKDTIRAYMDTPDMGKISVRLKVTGGKTEGLFIGSTEGTEDELSALESSMKDTLSFLGYEDADIRSGIKASRSGAYGDEDVYTPSRKGGTATKELYRVAKALVMTIRRYAKNNA